VADLQRDYGVRRRTTENAPRQEVQYGEHGERVQLRLWNTGLRILTNKTRKAGEPAEAGINLFYQDLDWSPFIGPGEPLGVIPKAVDQRPNTNLFDAGGIILPWCSNSREVLTKAIIVYRLADDLNTIEDPLLHLFQYYWDDTGYYLPAGFATFDQRRSMGEGPSSNVDVDFPYVPPGTLVAQARAV